MTRAWADRPINDNMPMVPCVRSHTTTLGEIFYCVMTRKSIACLSTRHEVSFEKRQRVLCPCDDELKVSTGILRDANRVCCIPHQACDILVTP